MTDDKRKKMLKRVADLIAKAEGTEFSAERDALRNKADDLMVRYAIEEAELARDQGRNLKAEVEKKSMSVAGPDSPYRQQLIDLHWSLVRHSRCQAVYHGMRSNVSQPVYATVVGMPADLEYVEMVFTSLRLQMVNELEPVYDHGKTLQENVYEMRNAGMKNSRIEEQCGLSGGSAVRKHYEAECAERGEQPRKNVNPKMAKRSFSEGFVMQVANRLAALKRRQEEDKGTGTALVPVNDAVQEVYDEMFPDVKASKIRRNRNRDYASVSRGVEAGKRADLGQKRVSKRPELA